MTTETRKPLIPSCILGILIFDFTEIMFFCALVSSYLVIQSSTPDLETASRVTLPVVVTAVNTVALLLSGLFTVLAVLKYKKTKDAKAAQKLMLPAAVLGATFVAVQGYEWIQLMSVGMTLTSGIFAALFFLLIGTHALHAVAGVAILAWAYVKLGKSGEEQLSYAGLITVQLFWIMIVGIWPVLYQLVYF